MPSPPRPSSTVILLRDGPALEVLLLVRQPRSGDPFSGASVFPGGVVDTRDGDTPLAPSVDPEKAGLPKHVPPEQIHSFLVAACRELFEEAGILVARDRSGERVRPEIVERLAPGRRPLQAGEISLGRLLAPDGLLPDPSAFVAFAHWITPEVQTKRWDTWFFAAPAPEGQRASCDGQETAHAEWLTPDAALRAYREGSIALAPPTFRVLEDLSVFPDVATVLAGARNAAPPETILPVPLAGEELPTITYPGDADYPGGGDERRRNRLVLDGGRWRSLR